MAKASTTENSKRTVGRPFPKGVSGNPGGRPKSNLTRVLADTINPKRLANKLYALALQGDMQAIKYIYDRIEGTPTQRVEFSAVEFAQRLKDERPELDDEKITYITERAKQYAEGAA